MQNYQPDLEVKYFYFNMNSRELSDNDIKSSEVDNNYSPLFFRIKGDNTDRKDLDFLLASNSNIRISNTIYAQLKELVKTRKPWLKMTPADIDNEIELHIHGTSLNDYGVWVYFPWKQSLVHLLDKNEFIELRTNRNKYKITDDEQNLLSEKKIGIIGLSVGQSIALTVAMERICGHIRLADFDTADLSNLNRLRTGVGNIGTLKTIIAAREILEMDPYMDVKLFNEGVTEYNIDEFLTGDGKLDLLIEVCDGLDVKVLSRFKAREYEIPVVMDTNDRGMFDVERFDLEPSRPILHGLAEGLDPKSIKGLSNEDKVPFILSMVGVDTISTRLKASMMEVEQSLSTWPQLASSVTLGGALTTDVSRRILLNQFHSSGRYYVDFDELIKDPVDQSKLPDNSRFFGPDEMDATTLKQIATKYSSSVNSVPVNDNLITNLLKAAVQAPSGGNAQPWKFLYKDNRLFIIHDEHFSYSLLDFRNEGTYIGFGSMLENIEITASQLNIGIQIDEFPLKEDLRLIAVINFTGKPIAHNLNYLAPTIFSRVTSRNIGERKLIPDYDKQALNEVVKSIPGAQLHLFEDINTITELTDVLTSAERVRLLNPRGHFDTFIRELRFSKFQTEASEDGMDINTLNMTNSEKAGLQIARDPAAVEFLNKLEKGTGFKKISRKPLMTASGLAVVSMNGNDANYFLHGGRAVERVWLEANYRGISFQPVSQAIFLLSRFNSGEISDFNLFEQSELFKINKNLNKILQFPENRYPVFIFRLFFAEQPRERALRRPLKKVLFLD